MTRSLDQALLQGADVSAMAAANLLVNSFHTVSQENGATAKALASTGTAYVTDQWLVGGVGAWAASAQQVQAPFPSQPDIANGLKISITSAAATGAADYLLCLQPIEGTNLTRLTLRGS